MPRRHAPRAVDLTRATITDQEAREVQEMLEHTLGGRCNGCGRRIGVGIKFTSVDPRDERPVAQLSACSRDDCGYAELCRDGATLMEMVEFVWLDEMGLDAPPMIAVEKRNAVSRGGDE
jgi:hypothetical protein